MVEDDLECQRPLVNLRSFHCFVAHDRIEGHPRALAMNAGAIRTIADRLPGNYFYEKHLIGQQVWWWLRDTAGLFPEPKKVVFAGKNFGAFDLQFLKRLEGWRERGHHHRYLDPLVYHVGPNTEQPPSLQECCKIAGLDDVVPHTAKDDAVIVVKLLRLGWERQKFLQKLLTGESQREDWPKILTGMRDGGLV